MLMCVTNIRATQLERTELMNRSKLSASFLVKIIAPFMRVKQSFIGWMIQVTQATYHYYNGDTICIYDRALQVKTRVHP